MNVPDRIKQLTETFDYNLGEYNKGSYNETQTRREFIDPFFEELGWDIANKQGYAEAYKDVIHEDAIKVGGVTKAPDYCFRIGGTRKFFLEAKKPSINIQDDIHPAYQLRRYGWSAKLPLSILTNFEEFAVYDCRVKPVKTDKVSHSRILYLKYMDYADRWEEIAGIFSRDAILKGSFDKYIESNKIKKGTTEVDAAFLQEIERWRELLARNIALRNPALSPRELNFAIQQTIDRIVFLRICEDRGIEQYGGLMALRNGENVYKRLFQHFIKADEKYNSGLFHFKKEKDRENCDNLTPFLQIDDKPLKEIFQNLYYPESPYEFSVLSADILGQVYEKFLGKVIRLTTGHQAKIEEKPEVRKAGGVYYTPEYIVDYIVRNTVGKLVEGKKPGPKGGVSHLKIVDPACGSGSFLIGAYQFLLDWHRDGYINDGPENWSKGKTPRIYQSQKGEWRLTTDERKRILLNNIYGVDIDHQAVEVTKLSLLLKVLEGEDEQSLGKQMLLFQARVLPDLSNNIKCGNSLIGPDFYDHQQASLFDEEELFRVNPFDWNAEFAEIMRNGGFDAVIGNPPYLGGREWKKDNPNQYDYFLKRFSVAEYQFDMYVLFWQQACEITRSNGFVGYITPNTWLNNMGCQKLRSYLASNFAVKSIVDYSGNKVFPDAVVLPIVTVLKKGKTHGNIVAIIRPSEFGLEKVREVAQGTWMGDVNVIFNIDLDVVDVGLKLKIEKYATPLENLATVKFGIKLYETGKGIPPQSASDAREHVFEANHQIDDTYRQYLEGKDVDRFATKWQQRWLKYGPNLAAPRDPSLFSGERVLVRRIVGTTLICTFNAEDYVTSQLLQIVKPYLNVSARYLTGVLNSRLLAYYFRKRYNRQDKTFPEIRIYELRSLPIRNIDFNHPDDKAAHDQMVSLVEQMLELNKKLSESKIPQTTEMLRRQIESIDRQIDQLVYRLYDLTEEEIEIVESETGNS